MYLWYGVVKKHCKIIKHYLVQLYLMECIMSVHTMEIKEMYVDAYKKWENYKIEK